MIIVIQCAASKRSDAGHMTTADGQSVHVVANPQIAPSGDGRLYAQPDDCAFDGKTWRQLLADYNNNPSINPLGLYPAYGLYQRDVYRRLVDKFGLDERLHPLGRLGIDTRRLSHAIVRRHL